MDFWTWPGNQMPEQSMDIIKTKESKAVKRLSWSSKCYRTKWSISISTRRSNGVCLLRVCKETWVVAGQIMADSQQYACSQCPEHPAVPGQEEHHHTGTNTLFPWSCSEWLPHHKLKGIIKGTCFEGIEAIKRAVKMECKSIQEESFYQYIEES